MTHAERRALIARPFPVVRTIHPAHSGDGGLRSAPLDHWLMRAASVYLPDENDFEKRQSGPGFHPMAINAARKART